MSNQAGILDECRLALQQSGCEIEERQATVRAYIPGWPSVTLPLWRFRLLCLGVHDVTVHYCLAGLSL